MMKDLRIDGRMQRVFVLLDAKDRIVYIPLKSLHRVDYEVLKEASEKHGDRLMDALKKTKLKNGRNALAQYESIIQVSVKNGKDEAERIQKPSEALVKIEAEKVVEEVSKEEPKRRGRPPKKDVEE